MAPSTSSTSFPHTAQTAPFLSALSQLGRHGWQISAFRPEPVTLAGHGEPSLLRAYLAADRSPQGAGPTCNTSAIATAAVVGEDAKERLFCRLAGRLIATIASQEASQEAKRGLWQPWPLSGVGWGLTAASARSHSLIAAVTAHRVLTSWYGSAAAPGKVQAAAKAGTKAGTKAATDFAGYRRQVIRFPLSEIEPKPGAMPETVAVAGTVLWPEESDKVMVVGFGGGVDQRAAEQAAQEAVVDRLAFLAMEQRLKRRPRFEASRRYALAMLMHSAGEQQVAQWLERLERLQPLQASPASPAEPRPLPAPAAVDLTARLGVDAFAVMKTAGAGLLPVVYGRGFGPYEALFRQSAAARKAAARKAAARDAGGEAALPLFHPFG